LFRTVSKQRAIDKRASLQLRHEGIEGCRYQRTN
jgi:hypothetical protein